MSPGEYFQVRFGPKAVRWLEAWGDPKLRAAVEEEIRARFDRQDGRDGKIVETVFTKDGQKFHFAWRRSKAVIGVLAIGDAELDRAYLEGLKQIFHGGRP
jgi:hypothetical protein